MLELGPFSIIVILTLAGGVLVSLFTIYTLLSPPNNRKRSWIALGACLLVIVAISCGFAAVAYGLAMSAVEEALQVAKPDSVEALRKIGTDQAMAPVKIAMGNIFALVIGLVAIVRGAKS